jgi:hypothetical protein
MLVLIKIQFGCLEVVDPQTSGKNVETTSSTLILRVETTSSTLILGGQQDKDKRFSCDKTDLTSLSRVSGNKLKSKMVKLKKPEIGVWKTIKVKGRIKHQNKKTKPIHRELPAKSKRQMNVNDASRPRNSKQPKSA